MVAELSIQPGPAMAMGWEYQFGGPHIRGK